MDQAKRLKELEKENSRLKRPPTEPEIARARSRVSPEGKRLSWIEVVTNVRDGAAE